MSRFADYFVVVGFDHDKQRGGESSGKVVQRFPSKDWHNSPYIESIEMFCQPLSSTQQQPTFFVFVLTDIDANRHYCACLSFNEHINIHPTKVPDDEEVDDDSIPSIDGSSLCNGNASHYSVMYAPKCLVLVSQHDYRDALKNCLGIIYTLYVENSDIPLENVIGNILACVEVPPPGGPQIHFSIGAGDRQCLQPPASSTLPVTYKVVHQLFEQLGIHNVVTLLCATMTEHKILFYSRSYSNLNDACHALTSLMYPFKYSHVYIPILPSPLLEVLSTPTPFIMGIHSSLKNEVTDLLDVIIVDLDGGSLTVPDCLRLPRLDEYLHNQLVTQLCSVIRPELIEADDAFLTSQTKSSPPHISDKEIRAIFMRMFAHILQGYRSCLTIIRIHPKPYITFHKSSFLGQRNLVESDFVCRLLDSMFFQVFVQERGLPYRQCDLFDELYASMQIIFKSESKLGDNGQNHIKDLANQLSLNETPNSQPVNNKVLVPTEGSFKRIHMPTFPEIDAEKVQDIIDNEIIKKEMTIQRNGTIKTNVQRVVPMGTPINAIIYNSDSVINNSARRLEVMRNCINCIFENKISDARKIFPAVLRALKNKAARLALTQELSYHVTGNKAVLEHQQFDLIVRLMNCALQDDSEMDVNGVAAAMLPLAMAFCRRLCTGVIQFAYTCIQEHPVWQNSAFWESTFYSDVERDVKSLYVGKKRYTSEELEPSSLDIAAEQIRISQSKTDDNGLVEYINNEESTVFSQAIHYANRMVSIRIPLDVSSRIQQSLNNHNHHHHKLKAINDNSDTNSVSNLTSSYVNGSDNRSSNNDNESGFEEDNNHFLNTHNSEIITSVTKFISRFVDKVCTDSYVHEEHIRQLHQMIPGVVTMHVEMLDAVWRESKRLPPIAKPKIVTPNLLNGEDLSMPGLRVFLIPDGREESATILLPAEGAIFLTNYRIIFRGRPCDAFASECSIVRSFPIASLTKEKLVKAQAIASIEQFLTEELQLRSNTFQLIKIAFDEEVSSDEVDNFRKLVNRERAPPTIFHLFTFTSQVGQQQTRQLYLQKQKDKNATFKGMVKKTLLRTAQRAGIKTKNSRKKYFDTSVSNAKTMASPSRNVPMMEVVDETKSDDGLLHAHAANTLPPSAPLFSVVNDGKIIDKLMEMSYVKDYHRLNLGVLRDSNSSGNNMSSKLTRSASALHSETFRISTVNCTYKVSQSYPGLIVVPFHVTDDSIKKFSRCYKHYRFPAITWRHRSNKSLLLRGSAFHGKGVMGILRAGQSSAMTTAGMATSNSSETTANIEQEKYLQQIVKLTPVHFLRKDCSPRRFEDHVGSTLSVNSQLSVGAQRQKLTLGTPESPRKTFQRAMDTLRYSGSKGTIGASMGKHFAKWSGTSTNKDRRPSSAQQGEASHQFQLETPPTSSPTGSAGNLSRVALYIMCEKSQIKGFKSDQSLLNCEFFPIELHEVRAVKNGFKKLMKAYVPSAPIIDPNPDQLFYKQIENSEWLKQIQTLIQCSVAIVDLMDRHGSSVMVCLEDGWDLVPQITSIAQLCLDPYYRTFGGFKTLIENEWLSFGHRFSHRSTHTAHTLSNGFAPIFLQFLDIVHQIHNQFPQYFEFNQYFLKFMAYHYVSCRFRTFMLDSELERLELRWIHEDAKQNSTLKMKSDDISDEEDEDLCSSGSTKNATLTNNNSNFNQIGVSFWEYAYKLWNKSPLFFNFYYVPTSILAHSPESSPTFEDGNNVLRPQFNMKNLIVWDYFLGEELAHGPSYDIEVVTMERQRQEESEATEGTTDEGKTKRQMISSSYDCVPITQADGLTQYLEEIKRIEKELQRLPQKWSTIWDKIEIPFSTENGHAQAQRSHKNTAIDWLLRGKLIGNQAPGITGDVTPGLYNSAHKFVKSNLGSNTHCDHCRSIIYHQYVRTGMTCSECNFNCHEKCIELAAKNCQVRRKMSNCGDSAHASTISTHQSVAEILNEADDSDNTDEAESNGIHNRMRPSETYYQQFTSSSQVENITHQGYLHKRGALLKGLKQRWFVLDSTKHQLRYYDSEEDPHCKGYIDLAEVVSVTPASSNPGAPFFDMKLHRRNYNFVATDATKAQDWIEKIQALQ